MLYGEQLQSFRVTEDAQNNHYAFFVKVNITLQRVCLMMIFPRLAHLGRKWEAQLKTRFALSFSERSEQSLLLSIMF